MKEISPCPLHRKEVMEGVMFDLFRRILQDEAGFTAIESSLAGALVLIAVGQLVANKLYPPNNSSNSPRRSNSGPSPAAPRSPATIPASPTPLTPHIAFEL